ncbi:endo-1,4-beta-xylanase [Salinarimonas soli]|uniref:Beta-xylanase n=1 Tax=Salinarimonas soli TaxID=1638099 RepID=A0A5B2V874_9HYPH|nr:endo-1,4-beta-xylanase [Salinarimonas soli]KAA2234775.1 endo-1,4-beta-xylanase [Salinarimonas soli]
MRDPTSSVYSKISESSADNLPSAISPNRRDVLRAGLLFAASNFVSPANAIEDGLQTRAASRGLTFGTAVHSRQLQEDPSFRSAILQECASVVHEYELKWGHIERERGRYDFSKTDIVTNFAIEHGLKIRGHTAVWHEALPAWAPEAFRREGISVIERHVRSVLKRYSGRIEEWDVVNEAIQNYDNLPNGFRNSLLFQEFGATFVVAAFRAAREFDPNVKLVYNDFGIEYDNFRDRARRKALLPLLRSLREEGLIDGFGTQSHLTAGNPFNPKLLRDFLSEVASMGLSIVVTEFDVNDTKLDPDIGTRDKAVAEHAKRVLDVILDEKAVTGVLTWGLTDRYTWLNEPRFARPAGVRARSLPLDENYKRKPLWEALASCLSAAPDRRSRR